MEESDKSSPSTPEILSYSPDEEPLELAKKAGKVIWFNLLFMTYDHYLNALPCCKNCIIKQNPERMFFTCMIQLSVDWCRLYLPRSQNKLFPFTGDIPISQRSLLVNQCQSVSVELSRHTSISEEGQSTTIIITMCKIYSIYKSHYLYRIKHIIC